MLKLYENIKRLRIQAGMTQDQLAARAGYTDRSSIAKIEKGLVNLPQTKIKQFADIFGVTPGDLMGWEQEEELKKKNSVAVDIVIRLGDDPDFYETVKLLYRLEPKQLSGVKAMLESMLG